MWAKLLRAIIKYGPKAVNWLRKNWRKLVSWGYTFWQIVDLVKAMFG